MKQEPRSDTLTISGLKRWSVYFTGTVVTFTAILMLIALLALAGWRGDLGPIKHPWPELSIMNPVTAMTFLLSGLSLLILAPRLRSRRKTTLGITLASLVVLIGLLRLLSVWLPGFWRVDYLLYSDRILRDFQAHLTPARTMSPSSAVTFVLSGAALSLLPVRRRHTTVVTQLVAVVIAVIGYFTLVCYLYDVQELDLPSVTLPMAAPSTVCFMLLSLGILLAAPGKGIMRQITGPYAGSLMARRSIPFALLVPILFGWAALFSPWRNSVSIQFSAAILMTGIVLFWLAFIRYNTMLLNRRDLINLRFRQALQASEEQFRTLVNSTKDHAIVMLDPTGTVISWNDGAEAITGYSAAEIIGRNHSAFYRREEIEKGFPQLNLRLAEEKGQYHREGIQQRKDGARFWTEVTWTAIRNGNHQLQGFSVINRDITERKRAQEKIAYQARLMEDSSDAIFAVDIDYRITSFNKAAETLYGYSASEVIGHPVNEVLGQPVSDEQRAHVRRELREVGYWKGLVVYHTSKKQPLDIAISISRTRDERGRSDGYIMVCRDMTDNFELRELTSRLQRAREDERGAIAREIHDELGQQLTGLKMDLSWIAKRLDGAASDQARQKLRSTMGLLDETIQTVRRIATDLRPSILDDLGLIAAIEWQSQEFEKRAGVRTVFQSSIPEIDFPPDIAIGMFRICQESLTNVARHASASQVSITLDSAEGGVCMVITDDGKGMDSRKTDRKTLGLIGMKERALMMGGRLEMGNGETKGFRLAVTVPLPETQYL